MTRKKGKAKKKPKRSELGYFQIFPKEILRIIISFCPHKCWRLNKYFRSVSLDVLPIKEKFSAMTYAATRGYLALLNSIIEVRNSMATLF